MVSKTKKKEIFIYSFLFIEPEQPASYYENINQLLKVCIMK
jgi:hypothetical protein